MLLAGAATANAGSVDPTSPSVSIPPAPLWQFDGSALLYGEENRANVVEPTGRIARLFSNGQTLSAQFALDAITGASPTGGLPTGGVQTTTTASGNTSTTSANQIPTHPFHDLRGALDLGWSVPIGTLLTTSATAHFSREKDYRSVGGNGQISLDLMNRLTTLTLGAGINHDGVFPINGTSAGLADSTETRMAGTQPKDVTTGLVGLSRVLTRRLLVGVTASRTRERGYLTDPYKVISVVDPVSGIPLGQITEKRPDHRLRNDVLGSAVLHLDTDVLYSSYRYYWDDWNVQSHTLDLKLRHDVNDQSWVQPHVRFYTQSRAQFFVFGLIHGPPLPDYASADERLGPLHTLTLGGTYGFKVPNYPGEFTVRAEYMYQWVTGRPPIPVSPGSGEGIDNAINATSGATTPAPAGFSIVSLLAGYTVQF